MAGGRLAAAGSPSGHHPVVVVGSGYGGAVIAARLAEAGASVTLLERGEERRPGEYPESLPEVLGQLRCGSRRGLLNPLGMFDWHHSPDVNVLSGSGLGGTSLINAGVALRPGSAPEPKRWPAPLAAGSLDPYYERATRELNVAPYPGAAAPVKLRLLERYAGALGADVQRAPVAVSFDAATAFPGQAPCNSCGNCVTGCNRGSKNTLLESYLPRAGRAGARIFTAVEVRWLARSPDGRWVLWHRPTGAPGRPERALSADVVVLAAGTLGSTEILLRSRARGLRLSPALGHHFSGNGDALDVVYDSNHPAGAVGAPGGQPGPGAAPGPCITGYARVPGRDPARAFVVQEGVIPGALAALLPAAMAAAAGRAAPRREPFVARAARRARLVSNALGGPGSAAVTRSFVTLVMAPDDARGQVRLLDDQVRVDWPEGADRPVALSRRELRYAGARLGGTFLTDPLSIRNRPRRVPITVHPLGGCAMGDTSESGAVDHRGRVFGGAGPAVHPGLYVSDGSVIPAPLGVNPLLTITALAERAAELMIAAGEVPAR